MALRQILLPWGSQPQELTAVDWSNPITRGLVFCAVPSGGTFVDLVSGDIGTPTGALTTPVRAEDGGYSRLGTGIANAAAGGTTDQVIWPASSTLRGATAVQTGTQLVLGGTTEQVDGLIYRFGGSIDNSGAGFALGIDSQLFAGRGNVLRNTSSSSPVGASTAPLLGASFGNKTHFFGFTFSANGVSGKWLGARTSEAWSGGTAFGTTATTRRAMIHTQYAATAYTGKRAYVLQSLIWDRELSFEEYCALYDNPWQLFEPRRAFVPVIAAAGTSVLIPLATAAATAFAPTVSTPNAVAVPAASVVSAAFAPAVSTPYAIAIPAASLALSTPTPTVTIGAGKFIAVPAAAITASALAPAVAAGGSVAVAVPAATVGAFAYAPSVLAGSGASISVPLGAVSLTARAPSVQTKAPDPLRFDIATGRLVKVLSAAVAISF